MTLSQCHWSCNPLFVLKDYGNGNNQFFCCLLKRTWPDYFSNLINKISPSCTDEGDVDSTSDNSALLKTDDNKSSASDSADHNSDVLEEADDNSDLDESVLPITDDDNSSCGNVINHYSDDDNDVSGEE